MIKVAKLAERLDVWVSRLRHWYKAWLEHPASGPLRIALTLAVLAACGWFIWQQVSSGYAAVSLANLTLEPRRLVISWLCITAATALGAWEWVLLVRALGADLNTVAGMSIHLTANLGKYLPGLIWPFAGKAYLASRRDVPLRLASASIGAELAIVHTTGGLLALLCLPFSGLLPWSPAQRIAMQIGAGVLAIAAIFVPPALGKWGRSRFGPWPQVKWWRVSLVVALILLTWGLLGFGFSTLYGPFDLNPIQQTLKHTLALAVALILGQVVFFLPIGIGVREAVFVALLSTTETAGLVIILAILFRLLMVIGELACTGIMAGLDRVCLLHEAKRDG